MTLYTFKTFWITCLAVVAYSSPTTHHKYGAKYLENVGYQEESAVYETSDMKEVKTITKTIRFPVGVKGHRNSLWRDPSEGDNHRFYYTLLDDDKDVAIALLPSVPENVGDVRPASDNIDTENLTSPSKDGDATNAPPSTNEGVENTPFSKNEDVEGAPPPDEDDAADKSLPSYRDMCENATIDTITRTQSGTTYIFKGDFYWKILPNGESENHPRKISDDWDGLEGNLDASVTWSNGKTFFFKGNRYWRFTEQKMDERYPKLISAGFEGSIPDDLDAALVWSENGKTYFFKGDNYWRYDLYTDPPVTSKDYPANITSWSEEFSDGVDAAFQWKNGRTYFFKGDKYYRYNDRTSKIDDGYPLSTSEKWFSCLNDETERSAFHHAYRPK